MVVENLPEPVLIQEPKSLRELARLLSQEPVIAVDTESNSLYAYQEQVCLIQFSTPETDYLVDPLALEDLSVLAPVFQDPKIEKIFHAAEYDLLCLHRDFDYTFNNLFDTMLAASILGREGVGLGSLLEAEFDVHLDKRYQRANWGQRPLPPDLLAYARLDTRYLIPLRDRLSKDLRAKGLLPLAHEDFMRLTGVAQNGRVVEDKARSCWRVSGSYDLTPQQAAVLFELCKYRDKIARSLNRPLFKVISDRTLLAIATEAPRSLRDLSRLPGMSRGQVDRHGKDLLSAVRRGLEARPLYPPRSPRPKESFLERLDALRRWRKDAAKEMGVKSDVVMPRDLLHSIAEQNPETRKDLAEVLDGVPWRLEHFGDQILRALART